MNARTEPTPAPVSMEINCPHCHRQHIDRGEWADKPHRTHWCEFCHREFRPFQFPTVGVENNREQFSVPLIPPSVNHYKAPKARGGFYVLAEAKGFIEAVMMLSGRQMVPGFYYHVHIDYYVQSAKFHAGDVDNFSKVAIDALGTAGIIRDDRYITALSVQKFLVENRHDERTVYEIRGKAQP